jgi:hypothetical protein
MTVSTTSNRINQAGDGVSTVFAFPYKFIQAADLKVYVNNVLITSGYTVGTPTDTGANVTFSAAPANGSTIVLVSDPAKTQGSSLPSTGPFPAKTVETALDKLTLLVQRLGDLVGRTFTLSDGDTSAPSTTLPLVSTLKGTVLAFDATTGAPVAGPSIASVGTVAGNTANINTVAGSIANVNTVAGNIATVNATGGSIANVNTVAANIAAVNTNATNITAIQGAAGNASTATTQAGVATTQAGIATTQAGIATTQATAAAASATAAAAAAASGLYRQVLDKSANYTIVAADQGTLFRASTGSGAVTFTLPSISSVTDGFKVSVVKWTSDGNVVNVNRAGSDTINGGTSAQIASQYSQVTFVADFETNQWFANQSGLGATNVNVDVLNGNGTTGPFTLSVDPGTKNNTRIHVGGVYQYKSTYSIAGTSLTFTGAPPSGTGNIEVEYATPLAIGTPSDGTVTAAKMAAGAAVGNIGYTPVNKAGDTMTGALTLGGLLDTGATGQVKFPASQNASADANTLDDYEEGTFTPAFSASGATWAYTSQSGNYVKVGQLVTAQFYIKPSSLSGTTTGNVTLTGLPFAASNAGLVSSLSQFAAAQWSTSATSNIPIMDSNATYANMWKQGASVSIMTAAEVGTSYYVGTITYRCNT